MPTVRQRRTAKPRLPPVQKPPDAFVACIIEALPRMSPEGRAWFERLIAKYRPADQVPPAKPD